MLRVSTIAERPYVMEKILPSGKVLRWFKLFSTTLNILLLLNRAKTNKTYKITKNTQIPKKKSKKKDGRMEKRETSLRTMCKI